MGTPRNVCHRCRHKWKVSKGEWARECPKCGHGNVGPTDPAPSLLPKLVIVGGIVLGGAYYTGVIGGGKSPEEAAQELKQTFEDASQRIEQDVRGSFERAQGEPSPGASQAAPRASQAASPPPAPRASAPAPDPEPAAAAAPEVVVKGRSGALLGGSYLVKGKLENSGGALAEELVVRVTFLGAGGAVLDVVEAECPATLEAGASARFEAACSGDKANEVEEFTAEVSFKGS